MNTHDLAILTDSEWTFRFFIPYIEFRGVNGENVPDGEYMVALAIIAAVGLLWMFVKGESRG